MKMQEKTDKNLLKKELQDKLDWYILEAPEEEYDEKAVAAITYLLDNLEPVDEEKLPEVEKAWARFLEMQKERSADGAAGEEAEESSAGIAPVRGKVLRSIGERVKKYRFLTAAVLLLLILALGNAMEVGAKLQEGFFLWLKRDETGTRMVTSPESLDGKTDTIDSYSCLSREEVPQWAEAWLQIEEKFEAPDGYEWQRFEVEEMDYFNRVTSCYVETLTDKDFLLGIIIYENRLSFQTESFLGYSFVNSYEVNGERMDIYYRIEDAEEFYIISFLQGNYRFYVRGAKGVENLKKYAEQYLNLTKRNL